jgi:hypothetical protein
MHRASLRRVALLAALACASAVHAQRPATTPPRVTVNGIAFDSLRGVPLPDAFIVLRERSRSTTSDERGRFRFDSVPAGSYTFVMQHAVFDSLGLSGATTKAVITDGKALVTLSVPSFSALWSTACGNSAPARDTGFVYGTVRDAKSRAPVPQAWVEVSWLDVVKLGAAKASTNVTQRRYKSEVQADANGGYAVCGVPTGLGYQVKAFYGSNSTPSFALAPSPDRVRRQDVVLSGTTDVDAARRGVVAGTVVDSAGKAVNDARIALGSLEARTDARGRFLLRNVPTGTQQVDLSSIGLAPISSVVDVFADDTTQVTLTTYRLTNLDPVRVSASPANRVRVMQYEARRKQGFGSYLDSTGLAKKATMSAAFQGLPGVTVQNVTRTGRLFNIYLPSTGTGPCLAMLYVDGLQQFDHEILGSFVPADIAAIEVYQQRTTVPTELMRTDQKCGVVAVWTKRAFR